MITLDMALDALDLPAICDLKTDALDESDLLNLILQRSEIIRDQPRFNRYIKAWTKGDDAPILELIGRMGRDELVRRAAAFIYLEYGQIKHLFDDKAPKKIADIGCGYALFDLFLAKEYGSDLVLIDLESNENRHFGFKSEGAAYSSLAATKTFLTDNGLKASAIKTVNPETDDVSKIKGLDYAFSFISCGFHYPWDTYESFFETSVKKDGVIILDMRSWRTADAIEGMSRLGFVRFIEKAANNSADRVMIMKTPGTGLK